MRRTQEGLASLPGVQDITFDPADDTFTVRYTGAELTRARVEAAMRAQVVAKPVRKLLDLIGRPFRHDANT